MVKYVVFLYNFQSITWITKDPRILLYASVLQQCIINGIRLYYYEVYLLPLGVSVHGSSTGLYDSDISVSVV